MSAQTSIAESALQGGAGRSGAGHSGTGLGRVAFGLFLLTAILTFAMIVLGASVTTIEAADSDPEWSLFNLSYWFKEAEGGRWFELRHRAFGTLIGALTVFAWLAVLAMPARAEDGRRKLKLFATLAVALVIVQGLLGGLRIHVVSNESLKATLMDVTGLDHAGLRMVVAMIHGASGQVFLALLVALCAILSRAWIRVAHEGPLHQVEEPSARRAERVLRATCLLIFAMLLLGAYVRHGRVFWPGASAPGRSVILGLHMGLAFVVVLHVFLARHRVGPFDGLRAGVTRPVAVAQIFVLLQILLGFVSWAVTSGDVEAARAGSPAMILRTAHVANGALLLALFALSWAWMRHVSSTGTAASGAARS